MSTEIIDCEHRSIQPIVVLNPKEGTSGPTIWFALILKTQRQNSFPLLVSN